MSRPSVTLFYHVALCNRVTWLQCGPLLVHSLTINSTHADAYDKAFAMQECLLAFFVRAILTGSQQVATIILPRSSLLCCFGAGMDDEEDTAKVFQEPCEQLGYSPQELREFLGYAKLYVQGQMRIYRSILKSLPQVQEWHMHEGVSRTGNV